MIDKLLKFKIEQRAHEIYEWRQENGIPGSPLQDWLDAEIELTDKRQSHGCPKCHFKMLAREDDFVICLSNSCDWKVESKRKTDKVIPAFAEIRKAWE